MRPRTLVEVFADPLDPTNNERGAKVAEEVKGYGGPDCGGLNRAARHRHEAEGGQHGLAKETWEG